MDIIDSQVKKLFTGEASLILGLIFNSISVTLLAKSDQGLSTISLITYVFSLVCSFLSFGTWSYIIQGSMVVILIIMLRKVKPGYAISFVIAAIYGGLIDFFNQYVKVLPDTTPLHILYYCVGFCGMAIGTCLLFRCCIPVLPFDTFTRDISNHFNIPYKNIRTGFDIFSVVISSVLSLIYIGSIEGIGVGTIINMLFMGMAVSTVSDILDKNFYFKPVIKWLGSLS